MRTIRRPDNDAEDYISRFSDTGNWQIRPLPGAGEENPMKLITKKIARQAQKQYPLGANMETQLVVAKFFDPCSSWTWYLMNQDPADPDYLWGIVNGFDIESGSFSLSELERSKGPLGIGIERDLFFSPLPAIDVWRRLYKGEHI